MPEAWREFLGRAACARPIFSFDETLRWEESEFDQLTSAGLLRETEQAEWVVCDACFDGHWEEVQWSPSVREPSGMCAFIACPEESVVPVPVERLRQWAVDREALARRLANLLELAGEIECLTVGCLWKLGRRRLAGRFRDVLLYIGDSRKLPSHRDLIQRRLNSPSGLLFVLGWPLPSVDWSGWNIKVVPLHEVLTFPEGVLQLDLEYVEDLMPRERTTEKTTRIRSLPVPEGARWEDLTMDVGETELMIRVGSYERTLSLDEAGFRNDRSSEFSGDRTWQILRLLASQGGTLSIDPEFTEREKARLRKQVSQLRQKLQGLLPIDGEPIVSAKQPGQYRCIFKLRVVGDNLYPTPAEVSWPDFRFAVLPDGRLAVGVNRKQQFRAPQSNCGDGRVVAEREERLWQEYSLPKLGLARDSGVLTPEGRALIALIQSDGGLSWPPGDRGILNLGRWLREWTGLTEDPFEFIEAPRVWTTRFECEVRTR